jgi:hypothetical protein
MRRGWWTIVLFVAIAVAAVAPIRSYDFFWHLATGRWIAEHHALPLTDPFAVASDRVPWINGEWLFELLLHPLYAMAGAAGVSIVRALVVALVFTLAARDETSIVAAAVAFAGANAFLDVRPSLLAPLFIVLLLRRQSWIAIAVITVLWINIHPSALLAPVIVALLTRDWKKTLLAAAALLVNPFGWRAVAAPIMLSAFAGGGAFVNTEWLPSSPRLFPLLYATIVLGVLLFVRERRDIGRMLLFALFALLAIRHVRHQPLYFAALPMLLPPLPLRRAYAWAAALPIAFVLIASSHAPGLDAHRWPLRAVARLKASGLAGHIYNPDQFGGFLIWSFYPERRALTDGRNELSRTYIGEYAQARVDSRAWHALLRKYAIDLAVDEYRGEPVEVTDYVTRRRTLMPASLVYWPRETWALIAFDEVGMVFARRAAFPPEVLSRWELRGVVPDAVN